MSLEHKFEAIISEGNLFQHQHKILIACSGGKDSMSLVHIFLQKHNHKNLGLAYFDHVTRNGASKDDGNFVEAFAKMHDLAFFRETTDIELYIQENPELRTNNFQEVARNLRYGFFSNIMEVYHYDLLATAHHKNDSLETFIFNLSRSSGPEGLTGIASKKNHIIRPLLACTEDEILDYVKINHIEYRNDISNASLKYDRNKIRHTIIPSLVSFNKEFINSSNKSMEYINLQNQFIRREIKNWLSIHSDLSNGILKIPIDPLLQHHSTSFLLFQILKPYGFNRKQVTSILGASQKGKKIISDTSICFFEKTHLTIQLRERSKQVITPKKLHISNFKPEFNFQIISANLSLDQLIIRTWEPGDYMYFSYGKKKLKKIFNEKKVGNVDKKQYKLIANGSEILWIIGLLKSDQKHKSFNYLYFT